jgi:hypothetical protein
MIQFDRLPRTNRTLLLATLELEMAQAKCTNILDLAHKRHLSIDEIWRGVCRKTAQPRCTVPAPVMVSRDQWLASMSAGHPDAAPAGESTAPVSSKESDTNAGRHAAPARRLRTSAAPSCRARRGRRALLVAGLAAVLALAVGVFALVASHDSTLAPQASLQTPNVRPIELVHGAAIIREQRSESVKQVSDPGSTQSPDTLRRLGTISKAFSKH